MSTWATMRAASGKAGQYALAEQRDGVEGAPVRHARPVHPDPHLLDAEPLPVALDLLHAVLGVAHDEAVLAELLDGPAERLTRGQHVVLSPLGVRVVLGGDERQRLAERGVHVARDVELLAEAEVRGRKGLAEGGGGV